MRTLHSTPSVKVLNKFIYIYTSIVFHLFIIIIYLFYLEMILPLLRRMRLLKTKMNIAFSFGH